MRGAMDYSATRVQMQLPIARLGPRQLVSMDRELRSRAHAYLVCDTVGGVAVIVTQRLLMAAAYINALGAGDAVAVASLYEACGLGRKVHRRWSVRRLTLDEAPAAFEAARREYPKADAVLVGHAHRARMR